METSLFFYLDMNSYILVPEWFGFAFYRNMRAEKTGFAFAVKKCDRHRFWKRSKKIKPPATWNIEQTCKYCHLKHVAIWQDFGCKNKKLHIPIILKRIES